MKIDFIKVQKSVVILQRLYYNMKLYLGGIKQMENKTDVEHWLGIVVVAVLVIYLVIGFSFSNKFFLGN